MWEILPQMSLIEITYIYQDEILQCFMVHKNDTHISVKSSNLWLLLEGVLNHANMSLPEQILIKNAINTLAPYIVSIKYCIIDQQT